MDTKQVIIIRKDLKNTKGEKIRTGKYIAQASHAVLGSVLRKITGFKYEDYLKDKEDSFTINKEIIAGTPIHFYLTGIFKKVSLTVNSEEELLALHKQIEDAGFESTLIIDSGFTEFGGIATPTCLAVEPLFENEIDPYTKHLNLF